MIRSVGKQPYRGIEKKNAKYIPTGIDTLDEAFNDLVSGTVTVVTGRPSEGKSTVVHKIIVNAIDKGFGTLIVDGEHDQEELINMLYKIVIGNDRNLYRVIKCNKKYKKEPKSHILKMLQQWHGNNLHIYSKHENDLTNFDILFSIIETACKKDGIDFIVLDNLMALIDSTNAEMNATQSKFMKRCTTLAKLMNVAIILVAHPNGGAVKGKEIDFYQISGTSDIPNLADNVIQVIKNPTNDEGGIEADGRIVVLKNRYYSEYPKIDLFFDKETSSLNEIHQGKIIEIVLDWRREGNQKCM